MKYLNVVDFAVFHKTLQFFITLFIQGEFTYNIIMFYAT